MMTFELINPSDAIYFIAKDLETATIATIIVGRGQYGAKSKEREVPIFMLGGFEEFCNENFSKIPDLSDKELKANVIECLKSFEVVKEQTSINNICQTAKKYAEQLEKNLSASRALDF